MIIYDSCPMFWDINEKSGIRKVRVLYEGDAIAVITSTFSKDDNKWICKFIPMGFSFDTDKFKYFRLVVNDCYDIFELLQKDVLESSDVIDFFGKKNLY